MTVFCRIDSKLSRASQFGRALVVLPEHHDELDGEPRDTGNGPTWEQELNSSVAKAVFRLNGQLVEIAEDLAAPAGLTAAWWRVLGSVLAEPLPVADIARRFGITRQSVQRVADMLVDKGLAEYRPNPAHRRAKLLCPTDAGRSRVRRIAPGHRALSTRLADELGPDRLREALACLDELSHAYRVAAPAPDDS